jgi:hypothetical protein
MTSQEIRHEPQSDSRPLASLGLSRHGGRTPQRRHALGRAEHRPETLNRKEKLRVELDRTRGRLAVATALRVIEPSRGGT